MMHCASSISDIAFMYPAVLEPFPLLWIMQCPSPLKMYHPSKYIDEIHVNTNRIKIALSHLSPKGLTFHLLTAFCKPDSY